MGLRELWSLPRPGDAQGPPPLRRGSVRASGSPMPSTTRQCCAPVTGSCIQPEAPSAPTEAAVAREGSIPPITSARIPVPDLRGCCRLSPSRAVGRLRNSRRRPLPIKIMQSGVLLTRFSLEMDARLIFKTGPSGSSGKCQGRFSWMSLMSEPEGATWSAA